MIWAGYHIWLYHNSFRVEGVVGRALDKYLFLDLDNMLTSWMQAAGVPGMSIREEVDHMHQYLAGMMYRLDQILSEAQESDEALELFPALLEHCLAQNLYSGQIADDDPILEQCALYAWRQLRLFERISLRRKQYGAFKWAPMTLRRCVTVELDLDAIGAPLLEPAAQRAASMRLQRLPSSRSCRC